MSTTSSRRQFIAQSLAFAGASAFAQDPSPEPIIDIHQHTDYHGRSNDHMIAHQRAMGITTTILLPAGTYIDKPSTHNGKSNGLAAKCTGNADRKSVV